MTPNQVGFLVIAFLSVLSAMGIIFHPSPIRAALFLVLNIVLLAVLYFLMGAQLMGINQIMVYAGAIMVLFLFVVMMLQLKREEVSAKERNMNNAMGFVMFASMASLIYFLGARPFQGLPNGYVDSSFGTPETIGRNLFTTYVWPFEVASILLLVGIVGSILLAKRRI